MKNWSVCLSCENYEVEYKDYIYGSDLEHGNHVRFILLTIFKIGKMYKKAVE